MKLFVDDIRPAPDLSWTRVRTISEAIRAINTFDYEEISLDHDISHQVTVGESSRPHPCNEDFSCICFFIGVKYQMRIIAREVNATITCLSLDCPERTGGQCRQSIIPKITLHTANPVGAIRMQSILKDFGLESEIIRSHPANRLEMEL